MGCWGLEYAQQLASLFGCVVPVFGWLCSHTLSTPPETGVRTLICGKMLVHSDCVFDQVIANIPTYFDKGTSDNVENYSLDDSGELRVALFGL